MSGDLFQKIINNNKKIIKRLTEGELYQCFLTGNFVVTDAHSTFMSQISLLDLKVRNFLISHEDGDVYDGTNDKSNAAQ